MAIAVHVHVHVHVHRGILVIICATLMLLLLSSSSSSSSSAAGENVLVGHALTLDHTNFAEVVSRYDFILVQFHNPWCKHCKNLAPEYEKAAAALSKHDPPIVLAKIDVREEANKHVKATYEVQGVPALKMFRYGGKIVQEYKGTRQANTMIPYLIKQAAPASPEIKSVQDATNLIHKKKIFVAGIFQELSGEEFKNFTFVSEEMRSDYDFGHTVDATFLPHGDVVNHPVVRLIKPFDELFVDFQDFQTDELEKFIIKASIPMVTIFDNDETNFDYVTKFLKFPSTKAMLFVNFSVEHDAFRSIFNDLAVLYKGNQMNFLMGDIDASEGVLQYYQLRKDRTPLIIIQNIEGPKYLKPNLAPNEIAPWLKDYTDGKLEEYIRSQPIPVDDGKLLKNVVLDTLEDMVLKSSKNVLVQFYAPTCRHSRLLMRTLDEVALIFEKDEDVMIAKLDATKNDVPSELFDVELVPKLYFKSANGNLSEYNGDISKESIIEFIQNSRTKPAVITSINETEAVKDELVKDEL